MILYFTDNLQRETFVEKLRLERPELVQKARRTRSLPTLAFPSLSQEEACWLEQNIRGFGKAHRDVQFTPTDQRFL
jgi:hypothetical protein